MKSFSSVNPATSQTVWSGHCTSLDAIDHAVEKSQAAFTHWSFLDLSKRIAYLKAAEERIALHQEALALLISQETGKPLWESKGEVASLIQKFSISIDAYRERCPFKQDTVGQHSLEMSWRPQGVFAVFGPFNFPMHLPNGHIVPALLAGNCVVFKPSDKTPGCGEALLRCFLEAGFPEDVIQIVQGGREEGQKLASHPGVDGLLFTGSHAVGVELNQLLASQPEKILALEMGGNNPLIVSSFENAQAAAYLTIQSAFITAGQRCSAARKLILIRSTSDKDFLHALLEMTKSIRIGAFTESPEPFMGPLINLSARNQLQMRYERLLKCGAEPLYPLQPFHDTLPFASPSIVQCAKGMKIEDEECFGPLLMLYYANDLEEAIHLANQTRYGLSSGIVTTDPYEWQLFSRHSRAGIINWNTPLTGASSKAPFGGTGWSGNHRPSGYLAADFCSYPVASLQSKTVQLPVNPLPGISL